MQTQRLMLLIAGLAHCIETIVSYSGGYITVRLESSTMKWEARTGEGFDTHPAPQSGQNVFRFSSNLVQTFVFAVACKRSISNRTNAILPPIWERVPPKTLVPRIKLWFSQRAQSESTMVDCVYTEILILHVTFWLLINSYK